MKHFLVFTLVCHVTFLSLGSYWDQEAHDKELCEIQPDDHGSFLLDERTHRDESNHTHHNHALEKYVKKYSNDKEIVAYKPFGQQFASIRDWLKYLASYYFENPKNHELGEEIFIEYLSLEAANSFNQGQFSGEELVSALLESEEPEITAALAMSFSTISDLSEVEKVLVEELASNKSFAFKQKIYNAIYHIDSMGEPLVKTVLETSRDLAESEVLDSVVTSLPIDQRFSPETEDLMVERLFEVYERNIEVSGKINTFLPLGFYSKNKEHLRPILEGLQVENHEDIRVRAALSLGMLSPNFNHRDKEAVKKEVLPYLYDEQESPQLRRALKSSLLRCFPLKGDELEKVQKSVKEKKEGHEA